MSDFGEHCTYMLFGEEVGDNGTPHLQGYLEFNSPIRLNALKRVLPTAHFEVARQSAQVNCDYCSKDGIVTEEGKLSGGQGARNDLNEVRSLVDSGATLRDVADHQFTNFIRYHKGILAYRNLVQPKRNTPPEIIILVGPTGTGKTMHAARIAPDAYWKPNNKWWDGYDNQHTVIFDEFTGSMFPFTELLHLLDRHPHQVESKGGSIQFNSPRIIITSNFAPDQWYTGVPHNSPWHNSPLLRRLREFGKIYYTGEVHRAPQPVDVTIPHYPMMMDPIVQEHLEAPADPIEEEVLPPTIPPGSTPDAPIEIDDEEPEDWDFDADGELFIRSGKKYRRIQ